MRLKGGDNKKAFVRKNDDRPVVVWYEQLHSMTSYTREKPEAEVGQGDDVLQRQKMTSARCKYHHHSQ
jgi:hypothetical protein